MRITNKTYKNIKLLDIESDYISDWDITQCDIARVKIPSTADNLINMQKKGFIFVDRTCDVQINLPKSSVDSNKLIYVPITDFSLYQSDILTIALNNFPDDRRFHITPFCSYDIAQMLITEEVSKITKAFVSLHRGCPSGFISLKEQSKDSCYIHLAAVDKKYRISRTAISLYAYSINYAKQNKYKYLTGRISTKNFPVMNIYSFLGATFHNPIDIFIHENI